VNMASVVPSIIELIAVSQNSLQTVNILYLNCIGNKESERKS